MDTLSGLLGTIGVGKELAGIVSFALVFVVASVAVGFTLGRNRLLNIFINIYVTAAIATAIPEAYLPDWAYARAVTFVVLLIVVSMVDRHLFDIHIPNASYDIFWRLLVTGMLVMGMTLSVALSLLPAAAFRVLPFPFLPDIFAAPLPRLLWLVVPLLILVVINKRLR